MVFLKRLSFHKEATVVPCRVETLYFLLVSIVEKDFFSLPVLWRIQVRDILKPA